MLNNKSILKVAGLAAAAALVSLVVAPKADAAVTTLQTDPFGPTYPDTLTFTPFDTSLGTLTAVDIDESYGGTTQVLISNTNTTAKPFSNASVTTNFTLSDADGVIPSSSLTASTGSGISGTVGAAQSFTFGGNTYISSTTYDGTQVSVNGSVSTTDSNLSLFTTGTSVTLIEATTSDNVGTSVSGVSFGNNNDLTGYVTVQYVYTPATTGSVPEPMTTLGSVAAVGLGLVMRRMKSQVVAK